jgi:hypothetical protein
LPARFLFSLTRTLKAAVAILFRRRGATDRRTAAKVASFSHFGPTSLIICLM